MANSRLEIDSAPVGDTRVDEFLMENVVEELIEENRRPIILSRNQSTRRLWPEDVLVIPLRNVGSEDCVEVGGKLNPFQVLFRRPVPQKLSFAPIKVSY